MPNLKAEVKRLVEDFVPEGSGRTLKQMAESNVEDVHGKCMIYCEQLRKMLVQKGIDAEVVGGEEHGYLIVGDGDKRFYVDPTIRQFNRNTDAIFVGERPELIRAVVMSGDLDEIRADVIWPRKPAISPLVEGDVESILRDRYGDDFDERRKIQNRLGISYRLKDPRAMAAKLSMLDEESRDVALSLKERDFGAQFRAQVERELAQIESKRGLS